MSTAEARYTLAAVLGDKSHLVDEVTARVNTVSIVAGASTLVSHPEGLNQFRQEHIKPLLDHEPVPPSHLATTHDAQVAALLATLNGRETYLTEIAEHLPGHGKNLASAHQAVRVFKDAGWLQDGLGLIERPPGMRGQKPHGLLPTLPFAYELTQNQRWQQAVRLRLLEIRLRKRPEDVMEMLLKMAEGALENS